MLFSVYLFRHTKSPHTIHSGYSVDVKDGSRNNYYCEEKGKDKEGCCLNGLGRYGTAMLLVLTVYGNQTPPPRFAQGRWSRLYQPGSQSPAAPAESPILLTLPTCCLVLPAPGCSLLLAVARCCSVLPGVGPTMPDAAIVGRGCEVGGGGWRGVGGRVWHNDAT